MSNVLLSPSNSTLSISNTDQKITLNNNQEVNINGKAFIVSSINSQSAYPDYAIMFSKSINPTSLDDIYSLTNSDSSLYIQNAAMGSVYVVVYFKSKTSYENNAVDISISKSPYAYVHPLLYLNSNSLTSIDMSNIVLHIKYNYVLMTNKYLPKNTAATPTLASTTTYTYINYNSVYPTYLFTFDSNKTYHMMTKDGSVAEETDTIILVSCPISDIDLSKLYIVSQNRETTALTDRITIDETIITDNLASSSTNKITYFEFGTVAPTTGNLPVNIKHISYGNIPGSIKIDFDNDMTTKDNILTLTSDETRGVSFYDENNHQLQLYDNINDITNLTSFNFGYYANRTLYIPKCDNNLTVYVYSHNYINQPDGKNKYEGFAMYIPNNDDDPIEMDDIVVTNLFIQDNQHVANKDVVNAYKIANTMYIYYINGLNEQFEFTLENDALYFTTAFTSDADIPENTKYIFNIKNISKLIPEKIPSLLSSMRFTNANGNTFSLDTISASGLDDYDVLIPIYNHGTMSASSFNNPCFIVYNNGTVNIDGTASVNYIDIQTNQALSLVGNNTSIQNNLNTLWTHLQPNIDNHGVKLHSLTPSVITTLNNAVVSAVNERLEELTKTNNNNMFVYSVSTNTIPWIVKTSETDTINRAIVYRDVNNIWYIAGNGGWYEFNGHDYANKTTTLDISDGVKYIDGVKGLWYKHRWLGWFATDENELLTIGEYSFRYYRSSVMANMFLIVL